MSELDNYVNIVDDKRCNVWIVRPKMDYDSSIRPNEPLRGKRARLRNIYLNYAGNSHAELN